jgi:hypothetical protein
MAAAQLTEAAQSFKKELAAGMDNRLFIARYGPKAWKAAPRPVLAGERSPRNVDKVDRLWDIGCFINPLWATLDYVDDIVKALGGSDGAFSVCV